MAPDFNKSPKTVVTGESLPDSIPMIYDIISALQKDIKDLKKEFETFKIKYAQDISNIMEDIDHLDSIVDP